MADIASRNPAKSGNNQPEKLKKLEKLGKASSIMHLIMKNLFDYQWSLRQDSPHQKKTCYPNYTDTVQ